MNNLMLQVHELCIRLLKYILMLTIGKKLVYKCYCMFFVETFGLSSATRIRFISMPLSDQLHLL